MNKILIKQASVVNEGMIEVKDVLIKGKHIEKIDKNISEPGTNVIVGEGKYLLPGVIDDQVHFREPGLTHKGTIYTEARSGVAGGVTSFMEMPNTVPNALTQQLLEEKYAIAAKDSLANYSFYMGASNDNLEEVLRTNGQEVCGIKIFMGSSTGNMLVDNEKVLENLFSNVPFLIATHCEDEETIRANTALFREKYGEDIPAEFHPRIRSEEACFKSTSFAVGLAKKYGTRLHVLHVSTAKETELFSNNLPLKDKKITAEACIHHLWFSDEDYKTRGMFIKWNPAVKTREDREGILRAVLDNRIDVIATDHAPHTLEEKSNSYFNAPSGGPLLQHSLVAMLELYHKGKITLDSIVEKMCHNPAIMFAIEKRGFIREGYYADLTLVDLDKSWIVQKENILAKCRWSPFEGQQFNSSVTHTFVSGHPAYENGKFNEGSKGMRLIFDRK